MPTRDQRERQVRGVNEILARVLLMPLIVGACESSGGAGSRVVEREAGGAASEPEPAAGQHGEGGGSASGGGAEVPMGGAGAASPGTSMGGSAPDFSDVDASAPEGGASGAPSAGTAGAASPGGASGSTSDAGAGGATPSAGAAPGGTTTPGGAGGETAIGDGGVSSGSGGTEVDAGVGGATTMGPYDYPIDPDALVGCRSPDEPGCASCCFTDEDRCIYRSSEAEPETDPWYSVTDFEDGPCPSSCEPCARCLLGSEETLRELVPPPDCDCDTVVLLGDDCFAPASCGCHCVRAQNAMEDCPPAP